MERLLLSLAIFLISTSAGMLKVATESNPNIIKSEKRQPIYIYIYYVCVCVCVLLV